MRHLQARGLAHALYSFALAHPNAPYCSASHLGPTRVVDVYPANVDCPVRPIFVATSVDHPIASVETLTNFAGSATFHTNGSKYRRTLFTAYIHQRGSLTGRSPIEAPMHFRLRHQTRPGSNQPPALINTAWVWLFATLAGVLVAAGIVAAARMIGSSKIGLQKPVYTFNAKTLSKALLSILCKSRRANRTPHHSGF